MSKRADVVVVGAGLAGCEASYQLAKRGHTVDLYEMRPTRSTPVHKTDGLAELVCSNSLRSDDPDHPVGLIKREMQALDSLVIAAARAASLPAGNALAVDRMAFSAAVESGLRSQPKVRLIREELKTLPDGPTILAAGPLCSEALTKSLYRFLGDRALYFYDAIAPVVEYDSLDHEFIFAQSRYDKGGSADYLNVPLNRDQYLELHHDLTHAERVEIKAHDTLKYFEGCLPVEVMADRGVDTLRFGPLKPVGLTDPRSGQQPYAVVQLRQDNFARSLWNMVGFQTQLKWGEQKRILCKLPGLEKAVFVRYGMIHRNTYVNSSRHLLPTLQFRKRRDLMLAGQICGVEGYVESAASGLMAGIHMGRLLAGDTVVPFPATTAMGSLAHYVSHEGHEELQPTNVNYGIFEPLSGPKRRKRSDRRRDYAIRAMRDLADYGERLGLETNSSFIDQQLDGLITPVI